MVGSEGADWRSMPKSVELGSGDGNVGMYLVDKGDGDGMVEEGRGGKRSLSEEGEGRESRSASWRGRLREAPALVVEGVVAGFEVAVARATSWVKLPNAFCAMNVLRILARQGLRS